MKHTHPISIIEDFLRYFLFAAIPLIGGLISAPINPFAWSTAVWRSVIILALILSWAILSWYKTTFGFTDNAFIIKSGIFFKRLRYIPLNKISTVSLHNTILSSVTGSCRLSVDTLAGNIKNADVTIWINRSKAKNIAKRLSPNNPHAKFYKYQISRLKILIMSATASNAAAGLLFAAPAINNMGELLGEQFSTRIYGAIDILSQAAAFGLPPAFAFIAWIFVAGWFISFIRTLQYCLRMSTSRFGAIIHVNGGLFLPHTSTIDIRRVSAVDIRQTLTSHILNLYSVYLLSPGYGKQKGSSSVIFPCENLKGINEKLPVILPGFPIIKGDLHPARRTLYKFLLLPVNISAIAILLCVFLSIVFPHLMRIFILLTIVILIPCIWLAILSYIEWKQSNINLSGEYISLSCRKFFELHTLSVKKEHIVLHITQSIFQLRDNTCNITIIIPYEKKLSFSIRHINMADLLTFSTEFSTFSNNL